MNKRDYRLGLIIVAALLWLPTASLAQEAKKPDPEPESPTLRKTPMKAAPVGMTLLAGYEREGEIDFEGTAMGKIWKKSGLEIYYAMGPVYGQIIRPEDKGSYLQYWEKVVDGRTVRFAYTADKHLVISFPLDDAPHTISGGNFSAKVGKPEDASDMVTMALSLVMRKPDGR